MLFTCRCRTRCSALNVPSSIAPQRSAYAYQQSTDRDDIIGVHSWSG